MKLYSVIIMTALSCFSSFCAQQQYCAEITINTSDAHRYTMPLWQVRESNTLYKYFLESAQQSETRSEAIYTPTISLEEIQLYSTALHQHDFEEYYYNTLTQ